MISRLPKRTARLLRTRSKGAFGPALIAILTAACGVSAPPPLEGAVRDLQRAIESQDAEALYRLQTSASRAERSEEALAELLSLHHEELKQLSKRLDPRTASVEARLAFEGEEVGLIYEAGDYRLNGAILGSVSLSDPESLVLALRRALAARDLKAILRLLTDERRAAILAQLDALIDGSGDRIGLEVEAIDTSAKVRLPSGAVLLLEREDGEWRLHDLRF